MAKEQLLIQRARLFNERDAFAALVRMHQSKVRSFLLRLTHQTSSADDIAQETFLAAYEKLNSFKGTGSFSGWLLKIAYNKFIQHIRSQNRREEVVQDYATEQLTSVDYFDSISPEQYDLEIALQKLKPEQAAAITLCHSYGYSHNEAAKILDIPVGTVKTNISRGKDTLRNYLSRDDKIARTG